MAWIGEVLAWAGPWAGWLISGILGTGVLWFYATDRLVSRGRHEEQAAQYEKRLEDRDKYHQQTMDHMRQHFQELVEVSQARAESFKEDRDYWREVSLDMMGTVASTVRQEP